MSEHDLASHPIKEVWYANSEFLEGSSSNEPWIDKIQCLMCDFRSVVFFRFRDVTKQNGCASAGTSYREPLGEILVCYDNIYKIEKGPRWGIYSIIESVRVHFCTHWRFSICFPVWSHFASLQGIYYLFLLSNGSMSKVH